MAPAPRLSGKVGNKRFPRGQEEGSPHFLASLRRRVGTTNTAAAPRRDGREEPCG